MIRQSSSITATISSLFLILLVVNGEVNKASAASPTILSPGDIQIVTYTSDAPDAFAFVTWVDLTKDTEIYFTDKGWTCDGNGGSFQSGESIIKFTAPDDIVKGSVYEFSEGTSALPGSDDEWTIVSGSVSWSSIGDQLIIYQGMWNDNPNLIYAFDTTGSWEDCDDVSNANDSALPNGLIDGVTAVTFSHTDNFWYKPHYSTSATLETLKEWLTNRDRFVATTWGSKRSNDYVVPTSFTILEDGIRGSNGYTEYIPGSAPCIIVSGHDGDLFPSTIVDRNDGCYDSVTDTCDWSKSCTPQNNSKCRAVTLNDENTQDMARRAVDIFEEHTNGLLRCHLIVNRLGRVKLDPNREINQATQFDPIAIETYNDFHNFIIQAKQTIISDHPNCNAGLLVDFHGHTHPEARIEMGYKITSSQLRDSSNAVLDTLGYTSSVRNMPSHNVYSKLSDIIRGPTSMGSLFELPTTLNTTGYQSIPSPTNPAPGINELYFQGGYNIETHGSQHAGTIDAIQIEFPRYLRAQEYEMQQDMLQTFSQVVLPEFIESHYPSACSIKPQ